MSIWIDKTYINNISYSLLNFKWKSSVLGNCSCPICEESKNKARGYFYIIGDRYRYICHNCSFSSTFSYFLQVYNLPLYKDYIVETFKESNHNRIEPPKAFPKTQDMSAMVERNKCPISALVLVSSLDKNHIAYRYMENRKIPFDDVYFCDNYFRWANTVAPEKNYNDSIVQERIVFVYRNIQGKFSGYSARALSAEHVPKYYTYKEQPDAIFGINKIDFSKTIYVVEGQIDSLFIDNCVAAGSSALHKTIGIPKENCVLIPDADIRNKEIMKLVNKFIVEKFAVCLLPSKNFPYKDINEAIVAGIKKDDIMDIIKCNTYTGISAMLNFNKWRKDE